MCFPVSGLTTVVAPVRVFFLTAGCSELAVKGGQWLHGAAVCRLSPPSPSHVWPLSFLVSLHSCKVTIPLTPYVSSRQRRAAILRQETGRSCPCQCGPQRQTPWWHRTGWDVYRRGQEGAGVVRHSLQTQVQVPCRASGQEGGWGIVSDESPGLRTSGK